MRVPIVLVAAAGVFLGGCFCMRARFDDSERASVKLDEALKRLAPKCEQWFVRECTAGTMNAVWLFRPRIDGPAETAAYDLATGELLYERQFGSSGGWAFTPVRQYGRAPACRPELDTTGATKLCDWSPRAAAAPAPLPSPAPPEGAPRGAAPSPEPTPSATPATNQ
jgi:hypothetical protein